MTARLDHAAEAMLCVRAAHRAPIKSEAQLNMAQAQVHATLALVEQQRIANLIAWAATEGYEPNEALARIIVKGLGL